MMSFKKSIATLTAVIMIMVCLVPAMGSSDAAGHFITDVTKEYPPNDDVAIRTIEDLKKMVNSNETYYLMNDLDFNAESTDLTDGGVDVKLSVGISGNNLTVTVQYDNNGTFIPAEGISVVLNGDEIGTTNGNGVVTTTHESGRQYTVVVSGTDGGTEIVAALYSPNGSSAEIVKNSNGNFEAIQGFTGTLYGNGYTITGLQIVSLTGIAGLFDILEGTVTDLGLVDGYFVSISDNGESSAGSFAGYLDGGSIENCFSVGDVVSYAELYATYAGGIVGVNDSTSTTKIEFCYSLGTVSSVSTDTLDSWAGGIVSVTDNNTSLTNCYNRSSVGAISHEGTVYAGGIAGVIDGDDSVSNVGNSGKVQSLSGGDSYAGGVTGVAYGHLSACYNMGPVSSVTTGDSYRSYAGGVVGSVSEISNCFNTSSVSASGGVTPAAGGIVGWCSTIYNCYSSVAYTEIKVGGGDHRGSIAGEIEEGGSLTNCYSRGTGSTALYGEGKNIIVDGIDGGSSRDSVTKSGGKSAADLKSKNTYFNGTTKMSDDDSVEDIPGWSFDGTPWQHNDNFDKYPYILVDGWIPGQIIILDQPKSVWAKSGVEVTFSVIAVSDLGLKYQWQESTNGTSWTNISGETSSTLTVSSTSTKSYKCVISTDSVLTATSESSVATLTIYTGEIKTVDDLSQLRSNPTGDYILRADLDLTEIDTNGGVDVTMTPKVNGGNIEFRFTYVNGTDDTLANGLNVWFNGSFGITDNNGSVTFPFAEGTYEVLIGGTVTTSNGNLHSVAVQYNIDTSALEPITKNSNGNFDPIGSYSIPFSGTLDGNGHTITGLEVAVFSGSQRNDGSGTYASSGLFGYLTGTVKDLILTGGSSLAVAISDAAETHASAGMVAGTVSASNISGCHVDGNVTSLSHTSGNQTSNSGGIVGSSNGALSMNMCSSSGKILSVSPGDADAGGLVGSLNGNGDKRISNGYNTGDIFAYGSSAHTGGITGDGNDAMIANCFSVGARTANDGQGSGISGTMSGGKIINCYFLGSDGEALSGGTFSTEGELDTGRTTDLSGPRTETQLKDRSTYYTGDTTVNGNTVKGWDFTSGEVWRMDGGYPTLFVVTPDDDGDGDDLDLMLIAGIAIAVIVVLLAAYMIYRRRS